MSTTTEQRRLAEAISPVRQLAPQTPPGSTDAAANRGLGSWYQQVFPYGDSFRAMVMSRLDADRSSLDSQVVAFD